MAKHETIVLHNVEGFAKKSGTDKNGCQWVEFEVDSFAGQEPGECSICGKKLTSGWLCLDSSEEVCERHVRVRRVA